MKTPILTIAASLLFSGLIFSCKDKKEDTVIDSETTLDTVQHDTANDTVTQYQNSGSESTQAGTDYAATGSKTSTVNHTNKTGKKGDRSKSGYSAPDGTDAENHDGDQYTRNDTTRMPTGGTIK
jgi:hypothetical protein